MATIVVEAFISVSVEALLKKIASGELLDFFRSTKLNDSLLSKLNTTLMCLQSLLIDAGERDIKNVAVKKWLVLLQDAVFEVEDLFDEINTEALRCKVKGGNSVKAKVWKFLSSGFNHRTINSKMQTLYDRLDQFVKEGHLLGLKEGVSSNTVWHGTPTSSVVDESSIFGRDSDIEKLKVFLMAEDTSGGGSEIGVISIVGMGGLGKTTLAKLLYNDPEVMDKFDLKGWASISKDFDVVRITKTILECITNLTTIDNDSLKLGKESYVNTIKYSALNALQVQLQQRLSNKKFLLVLDDIWFGNYLNWNNLKDIFNAGKLGSKLIITTRDKRVAQSMQTFLPIHELEPLQREDCWSILAKHSFGVANCHKRSDLEIIGKEIADKCKGIPLAAAALGGFLRINLSQDDWNGVLKSSIWELIDDEVQPALLLSYHFLPTPLKACFAYCSIFPKNSILMKRMVVQLWMAEGLVLKPGSGKGWEKLGEEYFDELVSRSLIHRMSNDGKECFEMHDLMNDLATFVSSPYCIRLDEQKREESNGVVRHLSYNREKYDSYNKFDKLYGMKGLRTFLPLPLPQKWSSSEVQDNVVCDLLPAMKRLRVLSLSSYTNITKFPKTIRNLIHLRYLNLSDTMIKRLPSETCELYNLQTLLLLRCLSLIELPEEMGKLVNLRHLDIRGTALKKMPVQIATLANLQTLSHFVVSEGHDGLNIAELRKFPHIQGNLTISQLENVTDPSDAFQANLKTKEKIDKLVLNWSNTGASDLQIQNRVLEKLHPSTNLKELVIKGFGGNNFPKWLGNYSSFGNMVYLMISRCRNCSLLPPLGQLGNLKKLYVNTMESIKSVGVEFFGSGSGPSFQPFPSLETLSFVNMHNWEEWELVGFRGTMTTMFPSLRCLSLERCPKLLKENNIFDNLSFLTELELSECPLLVECGQLILPPPLNSLRKLTIEYFPSLVSFPIDGLSKTLQSLKIKKCRNMKFLPHESLHNYTSLEDLEIWSSFDSMTSFTLGSLPVLKSLFILGCKNLKSILISENASQKSLSFFRSITIFYCNELESFSYKGGRGGFPIPNLIKFKVARCEKLCSLPEPMNTLSGLQQMSIQKVPNLKSIALDDLPISLRELEIREVGGISWNTTWEHLTCLLELGVDGDAVKALMKVEVPLLPSSLMTLVIYNLNDIECLDRGKWLQHLTSLQELYILYAPNLKSLPEKGLFPSSLIVLSINDCPLLDASLRRKRGKEWRKIAHIPFIEINNETIS